MVMKVLALRAWCFTESAVTNGQRAAVLVDFRLMLATDIMNTRVGEGRCFTSATLKRRTRIPFRRHQRHH